MYPFIIFQYFHFYFFLKRKNQFVNKYKIKEAVRNINNELEQAEKYIDKLEWDLETSQKLNRDYEQRIMELEQEIDYLRAQVQDLMLAIFILNGASVAPFV